MSHGIQFGRNAALDKKDRAPLAVAAVTPAAVRVDKTGGTGMAIDWKDGHRSHYGFKWLRDACPCANCNEERDAEQRRPGEPKKESPGLLPMYKAPIKPEQVDAVGRYAISFKWNDGHETGIYSWEYLRSFCGCAECVAAESAQEPKAANSRDFGKP